MSKKSSASTSVRRVVHVSRPFYFDAIREVVANDDLASMKTVARQAKQLLSARLDFKKTSDEYDKQLAAAIKRLDKAIDKRSQR